MNELYDNIIAMNPEHLSSNSESLPFEKISPRFVRILQKHNVRTYRDLAHFTEYEFGKIRGFGETMLREAQCVLEKKRLPNSLNSGRKPCQLTMRHRVIISMFLCGVRLKKIKALNSISQQQIYSILHRVREKYFHCDDKFSSMKKSPNTYLRMLLPFPSINQIYLPKVICNTTQRLPFEKMSTRLANALHKYNVQTYSELQLFAEHQLIQKRGCGEKMLLEAQAVLAQKGQAWSEQHPSILPMRDKVIAAMFLSGVKDITISALVGISYSYVNKVLNRVRKKFFVCDKDLSEMKKTPDKYLHKLFDFPSLSEGREFRE